MSEDTPVEVKPKQYMIMVGDVDMAFLTRLMPCLRFVEVEGMAMTDSKTHQVLVNPLPKIEEVKAE